MIGRIYASAHYTTRSTSGTVLNSPKDSSHPEIPSDLVPGDDIRHSHSRRKVSDELLNSSWLRPV